VFERPEQVVRQQIHAEQDAGVGGAHQDAVRIGEVRRVESAVEVQRDLVLRQREGLGPEDSRRCGRLGRVDRLPTGQAPLLVALEQYVELATERQRRREGEAAGQLAGLGSGGGIVLVKLAAQLPDQLAGLQVVCSEAVAVDLFGQATEVWLTAKRKVAQEEW